MNYSQILKRSWEILKANKFLWGLGILAGLVSGGGGMPSFNFPTNLQSPKPTPATIQTWPTVSPASQDLSFTMANTGRVLGEVVNRGSEPLKTPLSSTVISIIVLSFVIGLIVGIVILYFGLSARAGLILAVDKLETTGEKMTFGGALKEGRRYFWPIFNSGLIYFLFVIIFCFVIGLMAFVGWLSQTGSVIVFLAILGVILFFAFIVSCFYLSFLYLFVTQLIVLDQLGPIRAIKKAHLLVKRNWHDILLGWAVLIGVSVVVGLGAALVFFIIGALLAILGFGIYFSTMNILVTIIYSVIAGFIVFIALIFLRGFVTTYAMIYTTLVYRAVRYIDNQKLIN